MSLRAVSTAIGRTASASAAATPAAVAEHAAHRVVEDRHRGGAGERRGQLQRDGAEAEHLGAQHLQPEVERRLVDGEACRPARRRRAGSCAATAACCARRRRRTGRSARDASDHSRSAPASTTTAATDASSARRRGGSGCDARRAERDARLWLPRPRGCHDRTRAAEEARRTTLIRAIRLVSMSEEAAEQIAPQPCSACRGSGVVISNLGGEPHEQPCPWCDGGGVRPSRARRAGTLARADAGSQEA